MNILQAEPNLPITLSKSTSHVYEESLITRFSINNRSYINIDKKYDPIVKVLNAKLNEYKDGLCLKPSQITTEDLSKFDMHIDNKYSLHDKILTISDICQKLITNIPCKNNSYTLDGDLIYGNEYTNIKVNKDIFNIQNCRKIYKYDIGNLTYYLPVYYKRLSLLLLINSNDGYVKYLCSIFLRRFLNIEKSESYITDGIQIGNTTMYWPHAFWDVNQLAVACEPYGRFKYNVFNNRRPKKSRNWEQGSHYINHNNTGSHLTTTFNEKEYVGENYILNHVTSCSLCQIDSHVTIPYQFDNIRQVEKYDTNNKVWQDMKKLNYFLKNKHFVAGYYKTQCGNLHPHFKNPYTISNIIKCKIGDEKVKDMMTTLIYKNTIHNLIHRIKHNNDVLFEGELHQGQLKMSIVNKSLQYKGMGYKLAKSMDGSKYVIVQLGLLPESQIIQEKDISHNFEGNQLVDHILRKSKFRTNLCVVLNITSISFDTIQMNNPVLGEELQEAKSAIHTTDFVYKLGNIIIINNFDMSNRVCLSGIHFYLDPMLAIMNCLMEFNAGDDSFKKVSKTLRNKKPFDHINKSILDRFKNKSDKMNQYTMDAEEYDGVLLGEHPPSKIKLFDKNMMGNSNNVQILNEFLEYSFDKDDVCGLCYTSFTELELGNDIVVLPCAHMLCAECVYTNAWLADNKICPYCKQRLFN